MTANQQPKVKLPREVAEAIEHCRNQDLSDRIIMRIHLETYGTEPRGHHQKTLQETDTNILMQALVNGYEVERTPEDKVRKMYQNAEKKIDRIFDNKDSEQIRLGGYQDGITDTLDAYGIKIDGVNA